MGTKMIKSSQMNSWRRLDNSARIFPAASSVTTANVFRLSCVLREEVRPEALQQALSDVIHRFPAFNVRLRAGFFWYYFETNPNSPKVSREELYPCAPMNRRENEGFLFRVLYFGNRISLETYHALTDGTGALEFLKDLLCTYLTIVHPNIPLLSGWLDKPASPNAAVLEDGYNKIYKKARGFAPFTRRAYHLHGTPLPFTAIKVVHGVASTQKILAVAREHGVTVTAFLSSVLIWSIWQEELKGRPSWSPVAVSLPVNLRAIFDTNTALNFFECIGVGMQFNRSGITFEEILKVVSGQLAKELIKENLSQRNAYKVRLSRNPILRGFPLFIKNLVLRPSYRMGELTATTALSNLGRVELPKEYAAYAENFEFILSPTESNAIKCAVCSYGDRFTISFSSNIEQYHIQRAFFRYLTALGIELTLETNYFYDNKPVASPKGRKHKQ
ncbi:hypothetical protein [Acetanaerobacterium elongatum]|uniref:Uncharacterized protein, contains a NRPS condensation (Elongation) domain n=1 Tax=Acetanaerobacterium elongatum TaxID=258515 RepID=A0A1H0CGJ3_9FIRM|nr:hypothetical protein [Acetanaerobacterium elongatum]SDN56985.1 Uncharacterized protein, contains a NRPS condensation (elongation) domain [Acetanaerobacterium elongatum]